MKLVAFEHEGRAGIGAQSGRSVIPISREENMTAFLEAGPKRWKEAASALANGRKLPARDIRLLAPLRPRAILCSGQNYKDHRDEKPPVNFENPEFFLKLPDLVIDPGAPIVLDPRVTRKLDHETELAVVIGRTGRHIPRKEALDYVFGYTIMNDVTARDQQVRASVRGGFDYYLGPGKNFDTAAPLGPAIVTADEIPDPQTLRLRSFVNGEPRQKSNTSLMIWGVRELVAYFSKFVTLRPGFVISTGTPGRTGWGWDGDLGGKRAGDLKDRPARPYLAHGDVVRCEIEKIGTLENPVCNATS